MNNRIAKYLNENKEWEEILPENIKTGMKLKMFEPDGKELEYFGGRNCFVVISDSYLEYGVWTFKVDSGIIPIPNLF